MQRHAPDIMIGIALHENGRGPEIAEAGGFAPKVAVFVRTEKNVHSHMAGGGFAPFLDIQVDLPTSQKPTFIQLRLPRPIRSAAVDFKL